MTDPDQRLVSRLVTVLQERTQAQGDLLAATLAARWSASDRHEPASHGVAPALDAEAGDLHRASVHLRGGPLPRLQLGHTCPCGGCPGGPSAE